METLSTQTVPALISSHPVHDPFVQLTLHSTTSLVHFVLLSLLFTYITRVHPMEVYILLSKTCI